MSLAIYTPPVIPRMHALRLVSDTPERRQTSKVDDAWTKRTAYTHVLTFDAERIIAREDQRRVIEALRKYTETLLSLIFRGRMIHYAVNLRKIHMQERVQYLADMSQDIFCALQSETKTLAFDTGRELTPRLQQEITEALSWSRHIIRAISFTGGVVRCAVNFGDVDEKYHETVLMAIKGDIAIAAQIGEWN